MTTVDKRDSMEATVDGLGTKLKDTQLITAASRKRPLGLTDLPPTVRNNIYKHCLDTEFVNVGKSNVSYTHSIKDGVLQFKASRRPFPIDTALFYVNKQIAKEAIQYFYSKNLFIKFDIYTADARHAKTMMEDSGLLFSVAPPEKLEKSTQHAMDLTIVEKNNAQKRATVMFPAQYLPRLINFLNQASGTTSTWAPSHSLFINLLNAYDFPISRLQGDLLEIFRMLSNLGAATIDPANLLPGYAQGLSSSITAPSFNADNWLSTVTEMADRANEAREKGKYDIACQQGQSAIIAMTYGYLTRPEALHSEPETFFKSVQRLRWRCELGVGTSIAQLHKSVTSSKNWLTDRSIPFEKRQSIAKDMMLAETSVSQALSLATDSLNPSSNPWFQSLPAELIPPNKGAWFTDAERGMTWYACGIVHNAMGEGLFAAGDLERATELLQKGDGKDEEFLKEVHDVFAKLREEIDWDFAPGKGLKRAARLARGMWWTG